MFVLAHVGIHQQTDGGETGGERIEAKPQLYIFSSLLPHVHRTMLRDRFVSVTHLLMNHFTLVKLCSLVVFGFVNSQ